MAHRVKNFDLRELDGISENQISQHRDILYAGYVKKINEIEEKLETADRSKANQTYSEFRGLKADETFALNGVLFHELYFENLGGKGGIPDGKVLELIERDFGSFDRWEEDFKACGLAGRGWVLLTFSLYDGRLHNYTLDTHNYNVPALQIPLLVMDVYEHAYAIDYGVKRPPYIDAFLRNIRWDVVNNRLEKAMKIVDIWG